jgi:hypothetical protein
MVASLVIEGIYIEMFTPSILSGNNDLILNLRLKSITPCGGERLDEGANQQSGLMEKHDAPIANGDLPLNPLPKGKGLLGWVVFSYYE